MDPDPSAILTNTEALVLSVLLGILLFLRSTLGRKVFFLGSKVFVCDCSPFGGQRW